MCRHKYAPIAPEISDNEEDAEIWKWCIRCGDLKLGRLHFKPGLHQRIRLIAEK